MPKRATAAKGAAHAGRRRLPNTPRGHVRDSGLWVPSDGKVKIAESIDDAALFDYRTFQIVYHDSPEGFIEDCVDWAAVRDSPTPYQLDCARLLWESKRLAVRGPHGLGKTTLAALLVWWFALTRDGYPRVLDWKIITTAGTHRQLIRFLWPEIHKWSRYLRWDVIGRAPIVHGRELLDRNLKLSRGHASAESATNPSLIEGAHAEAIFFIYDESKAIPDPTFDATEGAFSGAGSDTGREALGLAISTPGPPIGRFYFIHRRKRGYEDWNTRHVTRDEVINAGRMSAEWAERRRMQWGEKSPVYLNRVLGEFAEQQEGGVIPISWLSAAHRRWSEWADKRQDEIERYAKKNKVAPELSRRSYGVDVAHGGGDDATMAERGDEDGRVILKIRRIVVVKNEMPTVKIAGIVMQQVRAHGGRPVIDVVGGGSGVCDQVQLAGLVPDSTYIGFNAGGAAIGPDGGRLTDRSGELQFADLRSAAWWHVRELLDPANGHDIALPPDDEIEDLQGLDNEASLEADLLTPLWSVVGGGKIKVESKDDIKKRLHGRSTDWGDAVVMAYADDLFSSNEIPVYGLPVVVEQVSRWRV